MTSNLLFSLASVAASAVSSLLLVPLYSTYMGLDAYGYVALGLTFVNVSTVLSLAITSMASRYIVVTLNKDPSRANQYFSSITVSCVAVATVIMGVSLLVCLILPSIIVIESVYLGQMRTLLLFQAGSLALSITSPPFVAGHYYKNDLRLLYGFAALSQIARVAVPYTAFPFVGATLWLPFASSFVVDLAAFAVYTFTYRRFMVSVSLKLGAIRVSVIRELVSSGCWASLNKAGSVLLTTVSSYMSNILVGIRATGYFASFSQLQAFIAVFTNALVGCLVPRILASYSNDSEPVFVLLIARCIRYVAMAIGLCSGVAVVLAMPFFQLWVGEDVGQYRTCIIVMLAYLPFSYPIEVVNQALVAQNRVKTPALVTMGFGVLNIALIVAFCLGMGAGITGVALAQMVSSVLRVWLFYPPFFTDRKRVHTMKIYRSMLFGPAAFFVAVTLTCLISVPIVAIDSWGSFVCIGALSGAISGFAVALLLLSAREKRALFAFVEKGFGCIRSRH